MTRLRIDLSYDGSQFSGWASQPGRRTVQGELESWLARILRQPIDLVVAGRTDAGVHARGQVCHADVAGDIDPQDLARRLRRVLPPDIVVTAVSQAPAGFDARFSAIWRRYEYRIWDDASFPDPLCRADVAAFNGSLDVGRMNDAGHSLLGLRDFAAFCKWREGATTIRTLLDATTRRLDDPCRTLVTTVRADAFCHSMVRSLMGAITQVGCGRRDLDWLAQVAGSGSRASSVPVMAASGLTLAEVGYAADSDLAARAREARAMRTLPEEQ